MGNTLSELLQANCHLSVFASHPQPPSGSGLQVYYPSLIYTPFMCNGGVSVIWRTQTRLRV